MAGTGRLGWFASITWPGNKDRHFNGLNCPFRPDVALGVNRRQAMSIGKTRLSRIDAPNQRVLAAANGHGAVADLSSRQSASLPGSKGVGKERISNQEMGSSRNGVRSCCLPMPK